MKTAVGFLVGLALLASSGCSSSSSTPSAQAPAEKPITGKWKGKIEVAKAKEDDPAAKMAEAMASMFGDMDLEIKDGNRYVMKFMGMPMEGSITRTGNKLSLKHEKVMGMTPDEMKAMNEKQGKAAPADPNAPMEGEISADGETISLFDPKQPDSKMVFKRHVEKPKVVGTSSVKGPETALVGSYKGVVDPAKVKPEDKAMVDAIKDSLSLKLEVDNTFSMNMMMEFEGKWRVEGDTLILTIDLASGMKGDSTKDEPAKFKIVGSELVPIPKAGEEVPPFNFVKE